MERFILVHQLNGREQSDAEVQIARVSHNHARVVIRIAGLIADQWLELWAHW